MAAAGPPKSMDIEAAGPPPPPKPARQSPRNAANPPSSTITGGGGGGSGPDVRQVIRESLGFPGALELVLLLSVINAVLSICCCAAANSGWMVSRDNNEGRGVFQMAVRVGWANYRSELAEGWTTDPRPIDAWSDGGEAMGSLSFIGHLISIFLSLAVIVFLWYLIAYGQAGRLGQHRAQARFLALALVGLGSWLFCFSLVGFPAATVKDFAESTEYIDDLKVDWAWGLSFLVTLFTLFNGGVLMRAGAKIDDTLAAAAMQ